MSSLETEIEERLNLINEIKNTFKTEFEKELPRRFRRGPFQKIILHKYGLPNTGPNKRLVNEAMNLLGYKKVYLDGWSYYKRCVP